jgi:hypothetical protein
MGGFDAGWDMSAGNFTYANVSTATTQNGRGSLNLVIRKTVGRNSRSFAPDSWVVQRKLAHNDRLKLDIANQASSFTW